MLRNDKYMINIAIFINDCKTVEFTFSVEQFVFVWHNCHDFRDLLPLIPCGDEFCSYSDRCIWNIGTAEFASLELCWLCHALKSLT